MMNSDEFLRWLHDDDQMMLHPPGCTHMMIKFKLEGLTYLYMQRNDTGRPMINRDLEYMAFFDAGRSCIYGSIGHPFREYLAPGCFELIQKDTSLICIVIKTRVTEKMREYAFAHEEQLIHRAETFISQHETLQSLIEGKYRMSLSHVVRCNFLLGHELQLDIPRFEYQDMKDEDFYRYISEPDALISDIFSDFRKQFQSDVCYIPKEKRCIRYGFDVAMGINLILYRRYLLYLAQLEDSADLRMMKRRNIVRTASRLYRDGEGKIVNIKITLSREGNTVSFPYPLEFLTEGVTALSAISSPSLRQEVKCFCSDTHYEHFDMADISSITYRSKMIYEQDV